MLTVVPVMPRTTRPLVATLRHVSYPSKSGPAVVLDAPFVSDASAAELVAELAQIHAEASGEVSECGVTQ